MPGQPRTTSQPAVRLAAPPSHPASRSALSAPPHADAVNARYGLLLSDEQTRLCTSGVVLELTADITSPLTVTGFRLTTRPTPHSDGDDPEQQSRGR